VDAPFKDFTMAARITELQAVNMLLAAVGEDPVAALNTGLPDAEAAQIKLAEISKDVQESGWQCNTEIEVTLTPDGSSHLVLPANTLRVDVSDIEGSDISIAERQQRLYNLTDHTYVFTAPLRVDIVYELAYEDLPYRLAYYIAARASRMYQEDVTKSSALGTPLEAREIEAKIKLQEAEEDDDANALLDSRSVYLMIRRNNPLFGR
jgi:hypothetical protein